MLGPPASRFPPATTHAVGPHSALFTPLSSPSTPVKGSRPRRRDTLHTHPTHHTHPYAQAKTYILHSQSHACLEEMVSDISSQHVLREKGSSVISNGYTLKQPVEAHKQERQGKETLVEELDGIDEDLRSLEEPPGWLPDGWIMEVCRDDGGSIYRCYTSPVSGCTFTSKMETLDYLFSGMEERMLESQESAEDNELLGSHTWLPGGWLIEVRAGGKKMNKMYKFYFHPPTGMRFLSKAEVLHYVNEGKISASDMDVLCDTRTDDNILAHVEFNPDGLPDGWVKETIFRNCNDGIRKDPYYTDPISRRVFRTLKSVLSYLGTGEISKHAYLPRRNVIDMYSFDKCVDLPQSMLKRLRAEGQTKQKSRRALVLYKELPNNQTSNHCKFWLYGILQV
ncbi:hypothetical protein SETIT_7G028500v2 [Setaria italica]|uniref:MBD domain-containing protein n=1 Tax=Setaria italica TaxID=4555 RepID=A0A368RRI1_SETIT|nr:hypothetical protein SETIT_7G028500v2 [Setaria italica]